MTDQAYRRSRGLARVVMADIAREDRLFGQPELSAQYRTQLGNLFARDADHPYPGLDAVRALFEPMETLR